MNIRQAHGLELGALALAALLALASVAWTWGQARALPARVPPPAWKLLGADFRPEIFPLPAPSGGFWAAPDRRELFPPSAQDRRPAHGSRSITTSRLPDKATDRGLKLLDVKPEPFRLQLAGFCGEPADPLAVFTCPGNPATILARPGHRFDGLGLVFERFATRRLAPTEADEPTATEAGAVAVLRDEVSGEEVYLDSRAALLTGKLHAILHWPAGAGRTLVLREGDFFEDDSRPFRIARIQLDPPEVTYVPIADSAPGPGRAASDAGLRPDVQDVDDKLELASSDLPDPENTPTSP